jgi:hypothetical protein
MLRVTASRRRSLALLAVPTLAILASCGGGGDARSDGASATTTAAVESDGVAADDSADDTVDETSGGSDAPSTTAASEVSTGGAVDPTTLADGCAMASAADLSDALGVDVTDSFSMAPGSTEIATCNVYLADETAIAFQVEFLASPADRLRTEDRPIDIGREAFIGGTPGYELIGADINGWYVSMSTSAGTPSEDVFVALGDLLEERLIDRSTVDLSALEPVAPGSGGGDGEGSCAVEVSGATTDSFVGGQSVGSAYASVWVPAEDQELADQYFPGGAPDFQISCAGPTGQSFLLTMFDVDVPLGTTAVAVPENGAGYFSSDTIIGNLEPFDVTLTQFDEERIVGELTFSGGELLSEDPSTVTVTFDFVNDYR